jgi:hypothetical protein
MTGASRCHQNFGTKKRYSVNLPKQEDNPSSTARYLQSVLQYLNKNLAKVFKYSPKSSSRNFSYMIKSFKYAIYIQLQPQLLTTT